MAENSREGATSDRVPFVVVGVDGSAGAKEALRWALAEGRLRNAPVRAVHAWTFGYIGGSIEGDPYLGDPLGWYTTSLGLDLSDLHRAAEDLLERVLADVGQDAEGVEIERQVVQGAAAEVLVAAATPGDLLVVGSRGHGDFAGLLLGSVSQKCVHHASCPVVVVHAPKPASVVHDSGATAHSESPAAA
jgi:nucleotide-binding universal stress UspA family protein